MKNESGIYPQEYKVLVMPKQVEEKTQGGVFIPEDTKEREQHGQIEGTLVATAAGAFTFNYEGWPSDAPVPSVGDHVVFSRYEGQQIKGKDGKTYWLMADKAIQAVLA